MTRRTYFAAHPYAPICSTIIGQRQLFINAQCSYRLRSDQFLSNGDARIRAFGSLAGEAYWPDIAANDDYEFSVGVDPDVVYIEYVVLLPSKVLNNTSAKPQYSGSDVTTVRQLSYEINLKLKNFKKRLVKVEYTL
ncbi:unnamed protein product [Didymodactylos carnosus]|uniref:Uncharacterized protein n=1 Tax=Didymodactylos carnosus TaxID=1234261 RepID=A0A815Y027_9BILA|nr:unnamed protein product [Didymodactylos carnosus]CAF1563926.1 unnamed protein product [Didymodactylos carnosus]CAF3658633.1 unnamed protein product [Didymodactylos carnosus]CAF4425737.1 unnamed protein product [Didymodactylos carnosus]